MTGTPTTGRGLALLGVQLAQHDQGLIQSFKQASSAKEREEGRARLKRAGQALIASPRGRATPADIQRAERALDRSATILIGMAS